MYFLKCFCFLLLLSGGRFIYQKIDQKLTQNCQIFKHFFTETIKIQNAPDNLIEMVPIFDALITQMNFTCITTSIDIPKIKFEKI